jgi:hypothetical protein
MPVRAKNIRHELDVEYHSLQHVIDLCAEYDIKPKDASIESVYVNDYGADSSETKVCFTASEKLEEFEAKQASYRRRLKAYNTWYEENKAQIEDELALRKHKEHAETERAMEKKKLRLERDLAKINIKLGKW